ncbi:MAG: aldo/keto reductase, partial [Synergistaceae bacterium]|nr:aldo/keto reductase [Synergistaceae bacterium]
LLMLIIFLAASPVHALGTQYVTLNDGSKMPVFGFGTWTLSDSQAEELVYTAIKAGYRLIDTARYYRNESGVGRGVRRAISEGLLKREEIFITSKLIPGYNPDEAIDDSNKTLGLDYIDLMLIHQPGYNDEEVYKALERAVNSGKVKSIGISNYYTPEEFERINRIASITPAIVQNENHIFYQNNDLKKYLERYGTVIESWYPLGGRGNTHELFNNEAVKKIAVSHGKTAAQVIIRWHIQAGYIAIPGSKNPEHIRENINVFDFALTDNDMNIIAGLNQNKRFEVW